MRKLTKQETSLQKAIEDVYQYAVCSNFEMGNLSLLATAYELQRALLMDGEKEKEHLLALLRHELQTDELAYDCYSEVIAAVIIIEHFELYKKTSAENRQKLKDNYLKHKYLKQVVKRLSYATLEEFVDGYGHVIDEHLMSIIYDEYDYQSLKYFGIVNERNVAATIEPQTKSTMLEANDTPFASPFETYVYEVHQMEHCWNHETQTYETIKHALIDTFHELSEASAFAKGANKALKMNAGDDTPMRFACFQKEV